LIDITRTPQDLRILSVYYYYLIPVNFSTRNHLE